ncbi:hypothetical protein [Oxynema aestuarii]|uniref:Uncharacterized protein n=1 Tax=Oxynema aestuarii AP17 TaxID=2064643 RepID=A0A6H1TYX5_9CYAN|nr:hypothetical protein [Oxynema aestuarii]QIZ71120.1 hypothetical protein HCG48_11490 [Oxynema aestuarii AP17]
MLSKNSSKIEPPTGDRDRPSHCITLGRRPLSIEIASLTQGTEAIARMFHPSA